jgi:iron(III) transport system ATP-binding protein
MAFASPSARVVSVASGSGAYLSISGLSKKFGDFTALRDISLDVREGEFVCFLGPSGCGKTTLLRAIAGLDIQTAGRIVQGGRDISALPPSERDFGIVFQSYALFPNLTVAQNIAYGLESLKKPKAAIAVRVGEMLALIGLPEQGDKYPAQLSGGQQQRVALARAMATSPGLLLLDEPLSALDAKVRVHLRSEIKSIQRRLGVTTIMVTHDQEEALTMADRIVVMNHGVIEQVGTPAEIYQQPATVFVADFIGTMNFMPGEVVEKNKVRLGGVVLRCETNGHRAGQSVTVAIRPEDLNAQDIEGRTENLIDLTVEDLEFLGSFYRARLSGADITGGAIEADFSMNLVRRKNVTVGDRLPVCLPPDHIRIYDQS